ncbi:Uu.00g070330.m01.CDS01 [Anthostomella pinea]|uniref:Uu.00g070330.m01.CDS01 n=1 Tax=Anthostomella pinea TaxID=933095 RepID=A0AAI8VUP1_9PEZI|nr:Uu.00g070330.m01.CDS01 [Anthostomella pinea]
MAAPTIPKEMKALQLTALNTPYELRTVPVPQLVNPYDLLVKVAVASHCHTDTMVASGVFRSALPITGSHEGAGTVVAAGSSVTTFAVGDRVMCGLPLHPCGSCADCVGPNENERQYCVHVAGHVGVHVDGCFAEYVRVDARSTTPLPDAVSLLSAAPVACAGRTIWRGVLQTALVPGEWVAIVGSGGGLGHLGVQFAKARGLQVVGIDARDEGLELSRTYGADAVVDARKGKADVVGAVQAVTGGRGADATIVISDADSAAALGAAVTKMHGTMVQIAQPTTVDIPFEELVFRDIRIRGSLLCSPEESRGMLEAVANHGVVVKTNPFQGLEKIGELVELVKGGKIQGKAVIVVDPAQIEEDKKLGAKY